MFDTRLITIIIIGIVAIILLCLVTAVYYYDRKTDKLRLSNPDKEDWLLKNIQESIYYMIYKKEPSEKICGLDVEEYLRYCKVLHTQPEIKKIISMRIEGYLVFLTCSILSFLTTYNVALSLIFLFLGAICCFCLSVYPYMTVKNKAEERLFHIKDDLPRFLALLEKAMDLPIDQAILITAEKFKSPLANDLLDCIHQVSLGANGWQSTLMELAKVYNIESFNDLVLEIVNSYEQGVNIRPLINRKAFEIEQARLYDVEAHDARIKTMIFVPVIALKVLPLMALICLPMLTDFI